MSTIENTKTQIAKGMLMFAVLSALSSKEQYGAELLQTLLGTPFKTQAGTLYPLLNRLHKQGLITSQWEVSKFGPPRKYYKLTKKGRDELTQLRGFWHELSQFLENVV